MKTESPLWSLFKAQLRVGSLGFGGPLASMAMMRDELVDRRKLVTADRYLEGLGAVKLMPGPVSSLLAVYLGLNVAGFWGGLVSVGAFVFPCFMMMLGICWLEDSLGPAVFQNRDFLAAMYGVQVAVLVVILQTCWKLFQDAGGRAYAGAKRPRFAIIVALIAAILAGYGVAELPILLVCSTLGFLWLKMRAPAAPSRLESPLGVSALAIFMSFFKAGLTVFGTGYMVLPYLQRVLVEERHWLLAEKFLDSVAYGNLTPGPIVIASTYMGYQISGFSGAIAATLGIFAGPTLLMLLVGPFLKRVMGRPWVEGVLLGLLPAVAATIAIGTLMLGAQLVWAPASYVIAAISALLAWRRLKAPWILLTGALLGLLLGHL